MATHSGIPASILNLGRQVPVFDLKHISEELWTSEHARVAIYEHFSKQHHLYDQGGVILDVTLSLLNFSMF